MAEKKKKKNGRKKKEQTNILGLYIFHVILWTFQGKEFSLIHMYSPKIGTWSAFYMLDEWIHEWMDEKNINISSCANF